MGDHGYDVLGAIACVTLSMVMVAVSSGAMGAVLVPDIGRMGGRSPSLSIDTGTELSQVGNISTLRWT